jgi:TrmH family RNA methyltransferase
VFHIPVVERVGIADAIAKLRERGMRVFAGAPSVGIPAFEADFTQACAVMIGNEGNGLSHEALKLADDVVHIPMPGRVQSLNASAAAAMLIYEAIRQRR